MSKPDEELPDLPFITSVYLPEMEGFKGFVDLKAIRQHIMSLMGEYGYARMQEASNPDQTRWSKMSGIYIGLEMALDAIDREINNNENS